MKVDADRRRIADPFEVQRAILLRRPRAAARDERPHGEATDHEEDCTSEDEPLAHARRALRTREARATLPSVEDLVVNPRVTIAVRHLSWAASRSGGPGGQNVNKVSSKVELRFDVDACETLT